MYEVAIHNHGLVQVGGGLNNPCEGLRVSKHEWKRITPRPVGLARAKALADEQPGHATVTTWSSSEVAYDNGKAPHLPAGWYPIK